MLLTLDGMTYVYDQTTGRKEELKHGFQMSFLHFALGAPPLSIPETIFGKSHLVDWHRFSAHHSLNAILGTLSRQSEVLREMGVMHTEGETVSEASQESLERVMDNAFLSFHDWSAAACPRLEDRAEMSQCN